MRGNTGVAAFVGSAILSGALLTAVPAHADANDDLFIQKLSRMGVVFEGDDARHTAVNMASETCGMLKSGDSNNEATRVMVDHYGKYIPDSLVMTIISQGVLHYCPEELSRRSLG